MSPLRWVRNPSCSQMAAVLDPLSWISWLYSKPLKSTKMVQKVIKLNKIKLIIYMPAHLCLILACPPIILLSFNLGWSYYTTPFFVCVARHSHSVVNTNYAHASSYLMWSLIAVWWLDRIPIKLQLTGKSRLIYQFYLVITAPDIQ